MMEVRPEKRPPLTPLKAAEAAWAGFLLFGVTGIVAVYGTRYAFLFASWAFILVLVTVPLAMWIAAHFMARRASFTIGWIAGLILSAIFSKGAPFYGAADEFVAEADIGPAINFTLVAITLGVLLALAGGFDLVRGKAKRDLSAVPDEESATETSESRESA
ncbi:MAG: hypothetical protein WD276_03205 [Actinomycetota bacterium]